MSETWIIDPIDPLIVRDGRPFQNTPGARAKSLPFPFPSTIAGGVRTRAGQTNGEFDTSKKNIEAVKKVCSRGPFLAERNKNTFRLLLPAPLDAIQYDQQPESDQGNESPAKMMVQRRFLAPMQLPDGVLIERPILEEEKSLPYVVGFGAGAADSEEQSKPSKNPLNFWFWNTYKAWLLNPVNDVVERQELGRVGPSNQDRRVHVRIDADLQTAVEGALFTTNGLTFWDNPTSSEDGVLRVGAANKLVLVTAVDQLGELSIDSGLGFLGGERRIMRWQKAPDLCLPVEPDEDLLNAIVASGHCRVVLLTPAYFKEGWLPSYLREERHGVSAELQAAIVGRPAVVSGWDFATKPPGPKPTKRLAPAGSIYYLKLTGSNDAIRQWVKSIWFQSVSDTDEERKAGFGISAVGAWSGEPKSLSEQTNEETSDA